jgi:hypothetical protein
LQPFACAGEIQPLRSLAREIGGPKVSRAAPPPRDRSERELSSFVIATTPLPFK